MKIIVWVRTDRVGSKVERTITVDDEDLEDLSEEAQSTVIDSAGIEKVFEMIEWGWRKAE